ncbi:taurine catabolism dioxygenase [Brachionus plicatilis]|uniref:Taurine catabolism dioxygenase n=1 Tax=Brachionus plicatilis TaxID=10195 RepID=A0A3M7S4T2_BRAPC|nr:taurine catabolism dioxygenase [Brachionus plicatilis]
MLNDFRTIFLIHDKRFLHILSRDDILFDYMSIENYKTIRKHRINTLLNKKILSKDCEIKKNKQKWLLKPNSLGKCERIILGKNVSIEKWIQAVDNLKQNFVIQEYIEQKKFFLKSAKNCNIVGTLLCFNDTFYCPGIYRASRKDLVSLSQEGLILYPLVQPDLLIKISNTSGVFFNHKPFLINHECFYQIESFSFKDADLYLSSLLKHGFVLLELKFEDIGSNFLMSLLHSLNMQPRSHGNKDRDYIWEIKPFLAGPSAPRSHTDETFQMHTDASYDINPARYFALQCLRNDRLNGGQNLVVKLQDILNELTQNEIDLLVSVKVKIKIPQEFKRKDMTEDFVLESILYTKFGEILVRYRHDIILNANELCDKYIEALEKFERLINLKENFYTEEPKYLTKTDSLLE